MPHHIDSRSLRTSTVTVALGLMLIGISALAVVSALPPPSNLPIPVSQYGVVAVYASEATQTTLGTVKIQVTSNGYGLFFVVKLLVFMSIAQQSDLTLSTISLDEFYTMSLGQYYAPQSPKIVVIPSGYTQGEVVSSLPSYLSSMLVKDPLDNTAIALNGGAGNGLSVQLSFASPTSGTAIGGEAIVTAPSNNTITITMS